MAMTDEERAELQSRLAADEAEKAAAEAAAQVAVDEADKARADAAEIAEVVADAAVDEALDGDGVNDAPVVIETPSVADDVARINAESAARIAEINAQTEADIRRVNAAAEVEERLNPEPEVTETESQPRAEDSDPVDAKQHGRMRGFGNRWRGNK